MTFRNLAAALALSLLFTACLDDDAVEPAAVGNGEMCSNIFCSDQATDTPDELEDEESAVEPDATADGEMCSNFMCSNQVVVAPTQLEIDEIDEIDEVAILAAADGLECPNSGCSER